MFREFSRSVAAYGEAIRLSSQLGLWKYFMIPILISILLAGAIGWAAIGWADGVGGWLTDWYPWDWGSLIVRRIGEVLGGLMIAALGFILYKNLVIIIAGPFMSPLSEKVENHLTGHVSDTSMTAAKFVSDLIRGIRIAIRNVLRELLLTVLLLLVGLAVVLSPIAGVGIFLVQSYYAGFGNMDYTLERHFRVKGSVGFVRRHWGVALGNGVVFMALLLTGVGFLFAPPLATVAATISAVRALEKEDVPV